jgi:nicotinamidase/pyrazinamidase
MPSADKVTLLGNDALIIVDVQNDFLPGGALAVGNGDEVIPVLNEYIPLFSKAGATIVATRDWHPPTHCSFKAQGGDWPPHCVVETSGAAFAPNLSLPPKTQIVSKDTAVETNAYSGFAETNLAEDLRQKNIARVFVGGLATDYCVLNTVKDAVAQGFKTFLLRDACRAVNVHPGDGERAEQEMIHLGAVPIQLQDIAP